MVNIEEIEESYLKFTKYIDEERKSKNEELETIKKEISEISLVMSSINGISIEQLLDNKDILLKFFPEIESSLSILEFLSSNGALKTDQSDEQLEKIIDIFNRNKSHIQDKLLYLENKKIALENSINKSNVVKESGIVIEDYEAIIDKSPLSIQDKLNIYSKFALDSIPKTKERVVETKVEPIKEETKEEPKLEPIKEEIENFDELVSSYNQLKEIINKIVTKYYSLIEGKNNSYLNYAKELVKYYKENDFPEKEFDYTKEELTIELLELIDTKTIIESIINTNSGTEDLSINIEICKEIIEKINTIAKKYEDEQKEEIKPDSSNVFMLLGDNGTPIFNVNRFDNNRVISLISKLEKGMHDYERGLKHTKLQTNNYSDYTVFINKSKELSCAYIRIDSSKVLIINVDNPLDIFDSTNQVLNRHANDIIRIVNRIVNNDEEFIMRNNQFISSLTENNSKKKGV